MNDDLCITQEQSSVISPIHISSILMKMVSDDNKYIVICTQDGVEHKYPLSLVCDVLVSLLDKAQEEAETQ